MEEEAEGTDSISFKLRIAIANAGTDQYARPILLFLPMRSISARGSSSPVRAPQNGPEVVHSFTCSSREARVLGLPNGGA